MNFYLAVALMWTALACVVAACCGLWAIAAKGWHAYKVSRLWADVRADAWDRENVSKFVGRADYKTGADVRTRVLRRVPGTGGTSAPAPFDHKGAA